MEDIPIGDSVLVAVTEDDFTDAVLSETNWSSLVNAIGRMRAGALYALTNGDLDAAFAQASRQQPRSPQPDRVPTVPFRDALAEEPASWSRMVATVGEQRAMELYLASHGDIKVATNAASLESHAAGWIHDRNTYRSLHSSRINCWYGLIDQFGKDYVADLYDVCDGDVRVAAAMAGGGRVVIVENRAMYRARHGAPKPAPTKPFAVALSEDKPTWAKLAHLYGEASAESLYDHFDGDEGCIPLVDGTVSYDDAGNIVSVRPSYVSIDATADEIERLHALHMKAAPLLSSTR